jgi:phage portal protein BeeE
VTRLWDRLLGRQPDQARFAPVTGDEWTYLMSSYGMPSAEKIQPTFVQYATYGYAGNSVVFAVIGRRIALFSEAAFKWRRLSDKRLWGDESLAKLEKPWPNGTAGDLWARMEQDVSLAGNAYVRDAGSQLERLRPDWVTIVSEVSHDALGREVREVRGYLYEPVGDPDRSTAFYLVDEVAHWAPIPDPVANFRGMSWMTPVIREVDADVAMLTHQQAFYLNAASPNMVIKYQGKLVEEQINRIRNAIAARHAGPRNAGGTMVLDQGADLTIVGDRMQGSAFTELRAAGESRIASASGVPALVAGLREGMQASQVGEYAQAMRQFADLTMRPNWRSACAALSVLVEVPDGSQLWYDTTDVSALQPGESDAAGVMQQQATTTASLIMSGFTPESIVTALTANDLTLLVHSGMTSVQLYKPGENNSTATPDKAPADDNASPPADDSPPSKAQPDAEPASDGAKPKADTGNDGRFDPLQPRDHDGKWSDTPAGEVEKAAGDVVSAADFLSVYGPVVSDHRFSGDGHVRVHENGEITVALDSGDGHEIFWEPSSADARRLRHNLDWATSAEVDSGDYDGVKPAPNGLLDWSVDGTDGLLVGFDADGGVVVGWPNDDGSHSPSGAPGTYDELYLSRAEAVQLMNGLNSAAFKSDTIG